MLRFISKQSVLFNCLWCNPSRRVHIRLSGDTLKRKEVGLGSGVGRRRQLQLGRVTDHPEREFLTGAHTRFLRCRRIKSCAFTFSLFFSSYSSCPDGSRRRGSIIIRALFLRIRQLFFLFNGFVRFTESTSLRRT